MSLPIVEIWWFSKLWNLENFLILQHGKLTNFLILQFGKLKGL